MDLLDLNMLDQISMLIWARSGNTDLAEGIAAIRLLNHLWEKLSGDRQVDELRTAAILGIANYVKEHPRASKEELAAAIGKQITEFAQNLEKM